ncbi:MAG: xanthine dehydrogenase accessory protein XdhC [Polyangiaceae bacterium]
MWDWLTSLDELRQNNTSGALVVVARCEGSTPREPGAKLVVRADGSFVGTIGGGHLEQLVIRDALAAISDGTSRMIRYPLGPAAGQCCGGVVEVLIDVINAGPSLYVFGAGHVGHALCRVLEGTSFRTHLIDDRDEWIHAPGLPASTLTHAGEWQTFVEQARWDAELTYAVVMTYRHDTDQEIVEALSKKPLRWLGLIGSKTKWEKFRRRLSARGIADETLARVRCPVGLPMGGKAPAEVAISIAAEILQIHQPKRTQERDA